MVSGVSGWPFSGATVTVGDASAATNEQGYFVLSGVPEGETLVAVTADGHLPTFRVVEVVEGGDTHLDDLVLALWVLLDFSGLFLCFNLFAGLLLWLGLRVLDLFLL